MEVRLDHLQQNFRVIRQYVRAGTQVIGVVKADGYGMGVFAVVEALQQAGCQRFAVATPDEAIALREKGMADPLLVLGPSPREAAEEYVQRNIAATVTDLEFARALSDAARKSGRSALFHLKIDTGMGRIGFLPEEIAGVAQQLRGLPGLDCEGVFTHFAVADERDCEYTHLQFRRYGDALEQLRVSGVGVRLRHVCNSAGTLNYPEMHLDAVRPGLILYGMWPSAFCKRPFELKEVFSVKTAVAALRELPQGWGVGYGLRYMTRGAERIAVLPLGYADGYPRSLTMKAQVLVRGERAPLVGSICMDQIMVNVTHIPNVQVGDEVVLLGSQGDERISPEEMAAWLGTINYEIPNLFMPRVPRYYSHGQ
jgi:alanine racemase